MPRKDQEADSAAGSDPRGSGRLSVSTSRQLPVSQVSHTPPPRPAREPMRTPAGTISEHNGSKERRPALERISPVVSLIASSERRPAMERLSLPFNGETLPRNEDVTINSGLLQDVEVQYFEETMGEAPITGRTGASGSKHTEQSPIRTLSEDRLHVSRRLGPVPAEPDVTVTLPLGPPPKRSGRIAAKTLGKRKILPQVAPKKGPTTAGQGVCVKKRRITKVHNSPKRKPTPAAESSKMGGRARNAFQTGPSTRVYPASKKKVADFRPLQDPLP